MNERYDRSHVRLKLTKLQRTAIRLLKEHGCEFTAKRAEEAWREGLTYFVDARSKAPAYVRRIFNSANVRGDDTYDESA